VVIVILPAGLHPIGIGLPDEIGPYPGPPALAAEDYAIDGKRDLVSLTASADPIDAQVQLALTAVRASGALNRELGQRFADVRKNDENAKMLLEGEARRALTRLTKNQDITLLSVAAVVESDWAEITIVYINNRAPTSERRRTYTARV
jgi:hypothetical protein